MSQIRQPETSIPSDSDTDPAFTDLAEQLEIPQASPPIGLALAGGAAQGAIFEIGALRALDEALIGLSLNRCGVYVGVSAGAFLASCLANGLSTAQMCRAILKEVPGEHPFVPEIFFQPAIREMGRRLLRTPRLLGSALSDFALRREKRLLDALTRMGEALPVAVFDNEPIREYVAKIFGIKGRTDDFRRLERQLIVVATDLESGQAVPFGRPGWDHVPISKAVQASTALPGLYPPVEINGRSYVDGVLLKTMHASVALESGADLVFCINPVVPVDTRLAVEQGLVENGLMTRRGLPSVLSQTVRTLIHSRMSLGLRAYDTRYPDACVVLIEPRRDDHEYFFSNIFSFSSRRAVCEHAYHSTRRTLRERREELEPILAEHDIRLNIDFLEAENGDLDPWERCGLPDPGASHEDPEKVLGDLDDLLGRVERLVARARSADAPAAGSGISVFG